MVSLNTFIAALMLDDSESRPIVIHERAFYRLSRHSKREYAPEELAEKLTAGLGGAYCVVYAANAMGPSEDFRSSDFLVFSPNVDRKALAECLSTLCDEPFSSCGSGECPEYVNSWIATHLKGEA
jgi:hypothetical protein